jgi:diguanylate cyclase (GGDEF)-like protein/PAS domain S-box-containing protein
MNFGLEMEKFKLKEGEYVLNNDNQEMQVYENYRIIFENASEPMMVIQNGHIKLSNISLESLTGYTEKEMKSFLFTMLFRDDYRKIVIRNHIKRLNGEPLESIQLYIMLKKDGSERWVEMKTKRIEWEGKPATINCLRDTTERKQLEELLKLSEEKYRIFADVTSDVVWIWNNDHNKFTYISSGIFNLTGYTKDEYLALLYNELFIVKSKDKFIEEFNKSMIDFGISPDESKSCVYELQLQCKNGSLIWIQMLLRYRYNEKDEIEVFGISRNIDERKKAEDQVAYLSYIDQLTGLYNWKYYEDNLENKIKKEELPVALIIGSVNGLEIINVVFGYEVGDILILAITNVMKKIFQSSDIIFRINGNEFAIILLETGLTELKIEVNRIKEAINEIKIKGIVISVSFGWSIKNGSNETMENVFYEAKELLKLEKKLESNRMKNESIRFIRKNMFQKNESEGRHSQAVSEWCKKIGIKMNLGEKSIHELELLGQLHDIGKIGISEEILNKKDKITNSERHEIEKHPEKGYQILRSVNEFSHIAEFVLCHHERLDETGYPRGLKEEQIPLESKILAVAEAYDIMITGTIYQKPLSEDKAMQELIDNSDTQFDRKVVQAFINILFE